MRVKSKGGVLVAAVASLAGAWLAGCSLEDIPHAPTFETDIRPLMLSRCVRCHGAGGHLNTDKDVTNNFKMPSNGFFTAMDDPPVCPPESGASPCYGLRHYTTGGPMMLFVGYIHGNIMASPMPPPPAPRLTTRQLDIIDLWLANGAPEN